MTDSGSSILRENRKLAREIDQLFGESIVKIGVLGKDFSEAKDTNDNVRSDLTVGQIAIIHEFGTDHIPQRSFLRSTWSDEKLKLFNTLKKILKMTGTKAESKQKALDILGNYMVGKVKRKFTNNDWPELKDPTRGGKNKKGNATPLVDTGQLRASISYEVIDVR